MEGTEYSRVMPLTAMQFACRLPGAKRRSTGAQGRGMAHGSVIVLMKWDRRQYRGVGVVDLAVDARVALLEPQR